MNPIQLTARQLELARHALGLPNRKRKTFRNRFIIGPGTPDHDEWLTMVAIGAAKRFAAPGSSSGYDHFCMTMPGARAALDSGESLCIEDFPREEPRPHERTCTSGRMIERKPGAE